MIRTDDLKDPLHHGGDTAWARRHFAYEGEDWLDLSTGINMRPYPVPATDPIVYHRLPQQGDDNALAEAAASYYGAAGTNTLVLAPGSQALIQWLPHLRGKTARVGVVSPTYAEHASCWRRAGHDVA